MRRLQSLLDVFHQQVEEANSQEPVEETLEERPDGGQRPRRRTLWRRRSGVLMAYIRLKKCLGWPDVTFFCFWCVF